MVTVSQGPLAAMPVITYSLRDNDERQDQYYRTVATFADEVVAQGQARCLVLLNDLQAFLQRTHRETPRTCAEYLYELLTLGVLWRCYGASALRLHAVPRQCLTRLTELRERSARLKPTADWLRGLLGGLFFQADHLHATTGPELTLARLDPFLGWLAATGILNEEVERLRNWRDCWIELTPGNAPVNLSAVQDFASWFEARSLQVLGRYTSNVNQFLAELHPHYRWRADTLFCGRRRVEYHLSMMGTEILNRAFRDDFLRTAHKVVLVPPCMRWQPEDKCQARASAFGAQCAHCTTQCHVHQVTKLGEKYGFAVFILPDELRVFSADQLQRPDDLGIVGVSCVLTNAPGGWETKRLGIPAQGLPLDYCGCHWHWHKEGIPTNLNLRELLRVLGLRQDS